MIDMMPPVAGFYRARLRSYGPLREVLGITSRELLGKGPWLPVRLWRAVSRDPLDGSELDRSPMWWATINGNEIEVSEVWPWCGRYPLTEQQYHAMMEAANV